VDLGLIQRIKINSACTALLDSLYLTHYKCLGSCASSFKRPLLSVYVSVGVSVCPQLWC